MSDPTMPAGLAAILSEPGWHRSNYRLAWFRPLETLLDTDDLADVVVDYQDASWFVSLECDYVYLSTDAVVAAADLMRRIVQALELGAALAQEGTQG